MPPAPQQSEAVQAKLIEGIMRGLSFNKAAEQAGISESAARERARTPKFIRALDLARQEFWRRQQDHLAQAAAVGLRTLVAIAADETSPPSSRIRAAVQLTDLTFGRRAHVEHHGVIAASESANDELGRKIEAIRAQWDQEAIEVREAEEAEAVEPVALPPSRARRARSRRSA